MMFDEFKKKVRPFPIFSQDFLDSLEASRGFLAVELHRWVKAGKLIRLKRGLYAFAEDIQKPSFSLRWLANTLYSPSYLSLEFVLSWYDLIPEKVFSITSITSKKTATFQNPFGYFIYRNLKKELFFGFEEMTDEHKKYILVATREKALLDFIYLSKTWEPTPEFLEHSLRLQQLEQLKKKRLKEYAQRFKSKKITHAVDLLLGKM